MSRYRIEEFRNHGLGVESAKRAVVVEKFRYHVNRMEGVNPDVSEALEALAEFVGLPDKPRVVDRCTKPSCGICK